VVRQAHHDVVVRRAHHDVVRQAHHNAVDRQSNCNCNQNLSPTPRLRGHRAPGKGCALTQLKVAIFEEWKLFCIFEF
jgi:hypothetical protein